MDAVGRGDAERAQLLHENYGGDVVCADDRIVVLYPVNQAAAGGAQRVRIRENVRFGVFGLEKKIDDF